MNGFIVSVFYAGVVWSLRVGRLGVFEKTRSFIENIMEISYVEEFVIYNSL
jgi:hypothetical protein